MDIYPIRIMKLILNNNLGSLNNLDTRTSFVIPPRASQNRLPKLILIIGIIVVIGLGLWYQFYYKKLTTVFVCNIVSTNNFQLHTYNPNSSYISDLRSKLGTASRALEGNIEFYKKNPSPATLKKIQSLADERKSYFVEMFYRQPDKAIFATLLPEKRDYLSQFTRNCIEQETTIEGTLEIYHVDVLGGGGLYTYLLKQADGKTLFLHPISSLDTNVESGTNLKIRGILLDNELIFNGQNSINKSDFRGGMDIIKQPGNPPVVGNQRTIVIMTNFQGTPIPSLTLAQVNSLIFTDLDNFYKENSYNTVSLSGLTVGYYTIPMNPVCPLSMTDQNQIYSLAIAAADPDVNFNNYDRVMIGINLDTACSVRGVSNVGRVLTFTNDGMIFLGKSAFSTSFANLLVVGHEMGHQFSNGHASFYNCGVLSISGALDCTIDEYGDPYSVMGNKIGSGHHTAPHKSNYGWLSEGTTLKTITSSGTYSIEPIETATGLTKALRIPRSELDYLWIEYRQPIGFDSSIPAPFNGALFHIGQTFGFSLGTPSYLIDPTPPGSNINSALLSGETFTDPDTKTKVTVSSVSPSALTLNIVVGKTNFTPPTVSITSPLDNQTVSGIITVSANASSLSGIEKVEFYYIDFALGPVLFGTSFVAPYSASLNTAILPNGTNRLMAKAYDLSGQPLGLPNNSNYSSMIGINVNNGASTPTPVPTPLDTIPPTVSITSPTPGQVVGGITAINVTATDTGGSGMKEVEFLIDGVSKFIDNIPPYSYSWDTTAYANGNHTIKVWARDWAGNRADPPIVVVVSNGPGQQSGYRVQIATNSSFTSIVSDSCPSGVGCGGGASTIYTIPSGLLLNTIYYARVMVWNSVGTPSAWTSMTLCNGYPVSPGGCQPGNTSWRTPRNAWPDVQPTLHDPLFSPSAPGVGSPVKFTDRTTFSGLGPNTWLWNFGDTTTSLLQNPSHTYAIQGPYSFTLRSTDANGYACTSAPKVITVGKPIPIWKEVLPR